MLCDFHFFIKNLTTNEAGTFTGQLYYIHTSFTVNRIPCHGYTLKYTSYQNPLRNINFTWVSPKDIFQLTKFQTFPGNNTFRTWFAQFSLLNFFFVWHNLTYFVSDTKPGIGTNLIFNHILGSSAVSVVLCALVVVSFLTIGLMKRRKSKSFFFK